MFNAFAYVALAVLVYFVLRKAIKPLITAGENVSRVAELNSEMYLANAQHELDVKRKELANKLAEAEE